MGFLPCKCHDCDCQHCEAFTNISVRVNRDMLLKDNELLRQELFEARDGQPPTFADLSDCLRTVFW